MNAEYLGDGVYVEEANGAVVLFCDNGIYRSQEIFLEWEVMTNLIRYLEKFRHTLELKGEL